MHHNYSQGHIHLPYGWAVWCDVRNAFALETEVFEKIPSGTQHPVYQPLLKSFYNKIYFQEKKKNKWFQTNFTFMWAILESKCIFLDWVEGLSGSWVLGKHGLRHRRMRPYPKCVPFEPSISPQI